MFFFCRMSEAPGLTQTTLLLFKLWGSCELSSLIWCWLVTCVSVLTRHTVTVVSMLISLGQQCDGLPPWGECNTSVCLSFISALKGSCVKTAPWTTPPAVCDWRRWRWRTHVPVSLKSVKLFYLDPVIFTIRLYLSVYPGCHIIAPSDMMDGRIASIKQALISNDFGNKVNHHQWSTLYKYRSFWVFFNFESYSFLT